MTPLKINQVAAGGRNVTYQIHGHAEKGELPPTPVQMSKGLKLSSALWIVQEKLTLHLWWSEDDYLFPMESRNSARFDSCIKPPDEWNGIIYLSSSNWGVPPTPGGKRFFVILDFDR
jgi:hypothetical protein